MSDWSDGVPSAMVSNTNVGGGGSSNWGSALPAGLSFIGAMSSYSGYKAAAAAVVSAGQAQAATYQFKAKQERINAGQAMAASEAQAAEVARQGQLALSHNMALVAAGGTAGSPTAIRLMAKQAGFTSYQQSLALYQGEDAARSLTMAAEADDMSAQSAIQNADYQADALNTKAKGAVISGATDLFSKYGSSFFKS